MPMKMMMMLNREVKRVPLNFDWQLHKIWKGYINPYYKKCPHCEGGYTKARRRLQEYIDSLCFYGDDDETKQLIEGLVGRKPTLFNFYDSGARYEVEKKIIAFAHLDPQIWGICSSCKGEAIDISIKKESDAWKPYEPPKGKGYQCWETVSEGSPISPVFKTFDELCEWLAGHLSGITEEFTKEDWKNALQDDCPLLDIGTQKLVTSEKKKK